MPRIYLVWVLGALEALQCIICHYLRTDGITELRTDQAFYYNRFYLFLTAKEAVQQSIRSICVSVCLFVCHNLEVLLLKGSNQPIRAQFETN